MKIPLPLPRTTARDEARYWAKVVQDGDCWRFTSNINSAGYGMFRIGERKYLAHRLSYTMLVDEIPPGLTIDHLCRNRFCVNPDHLDPVPPAVNTARGIRPTGGWRINRPSECIHGHEYTEENTYVAPDGAWRCRTCRRADWSRLNEKRKAQRHLVRGAAA